MSFESTGMKRIVPGLTGSDRGGEDRQEPTYADVAGGEEPPGSGGEKRESAWL